MKSGLDEGLDHLAMRDLMSICSVAQDSGIIISHPGEDVELLCALPNG